MDNKVLQDELKRMMRAEGINLLAASIRLHDKVSVAVDEVREEIIAEGDYAHCTACDMLIDLDKDIYTVLNDETYCQSCSEKEEV